MVGFVTWTPHTCNPFHIKLIDKSGQATKPIIRTCNSYTIDYCMSFKEIKVFLIK